MRDRTCPAKASTCPNLSDENGGVLPFRTGSDRLDRFFAMSAHARIRRRAHAHAHASRVATNLSNLPDPRQTATFDPEELSGNLSGDLSDPASEGALP